MSIERRKSKDGSVKYRVRIYQNKTMVKESHFTKRFDAEKWEAEQKVASERERHFPSQVTNILFSELYDLWLKNHAEIKKAFNSVTKDKQVYRDYIGPFIGSLKASLIAPTDIDNMVIRLKKRTELSNNSINKVLQITKALFNYGIKKRHILYNPVTSVEFLPVEPTAFGYWTKGEAETFLRYADSKHKENRTPYLIYLTALLTGMRAGELFALKWDSVDLAKNLITIRRSTDRLKGTIKETTKSNKIRYVGISDDLFAELTKHRNKNTKAEFVFENNIKDFIDPDNFRNRFFIKDVKKSGVKLIRFHDLRHTFASHYVMNGGTIYGLQMILGHSDVKTTMRYAHLAPDHIVHTANIVSFLQKKTPEIDVPSNVVSARF